MRFLNACSVVLPLLLIACSPSTPAAVSKPDFAAEEKGRIPHHGHRRERRARRQGRFVTVWKKVGSEWKVAHDIGSTTMPEAPSEKK